MILPNTNLVGIHANQTPSKKSPKPKKKTIKTKTIKKQRLSSSSSSHIPREIETAKKLI
jgi:hypothetical protein